MHLKLKEKIRNTKICVFESIRVWAGIAAGDLTICYLFQVSSLRDKRENFPVASPQKMRETHLMAADRCDILRLIFRSFSLVFCQWQIIGGTAQSGWPPGERHLIRKRHLPADKGDQHFGDIRCDVFHRIIVRFCTGCRVLCHLAGENIFNFNDLHWKIVTLRASQIRWVIVLISRIIGMALGYGRKLIAEWIYFYTFVQPERAGWVPFMDF